ncbi:MAG: glycosyltransferase [Candidatus Nanopelagicales bacterium]
MVKTSKIIKQSLQESIGKNLFLTPNGRLSAKFSKSKHRKYLRYLELHIIFPIHLIYTRVIYSIERILIVDHSDAMHLFFFKKNVATVMVHDQFAYLAAHSKIPDVRIRKSGRLYQALIHKGMKRSRKLLAVSEYTKQYLIKLNFTQEIKVLNLTWNPWTSGESNKEMTNCPLDEYAILVSPNSWRKNRPLAINCILELRKFAEFRSLKLHIVGDVLSDLELSEINSENLEFITITGGISDQELKLLYQKSKFCILTSKYEGYGLPILEANSLGVPCLHNELPSFMEITNNQNVILKEPLEANTWPLLITQISNLTISQQLASDTEQRFGFQHFKNKLQLHYFS